MRFVVRFVVHFVVRGRARARLGLVSVGPRKKGGLKLYRISVNGSLFTATWDYRAVVHSMSCRTSITFANHLDRVRK